MRRLIALKHTHVITPEVVVKLAGDDVCMVLNDSSDNAKIIAGFGVLDEVVVGAAEGGFETVKNMLSDVADWYFGYLTYDLKNDTEKLVSHNTDFLDFPFAKFFRPKYVLIFDELGLRLGYDDMVDDELSARGWFKQFFRAEAERLQPEHAIRLTAREGRPSYLDKIAALQQHIQMGDIYEVNFCQEFYAENVSVAPKLVYKSLNERTKAPFSCYFQDETHHLMCGSPERFLKKEGSKITSQPIKGTIKRGQSAAEDDLLKAQLASDPKERGENVMIVDLVRNDLSKTAVKGSVKVDELFGVYTFETVHQMISTVSSELRDDVHPIDAIKSAFPMGSMTGAPKVRAMELIEEYESTKRGLYSGAVGYFTPDGDFDFNVIIRSILYNSQQKYLSVMVGGAITALSEPEKEYDECLLKAQAMFDVLCNDLAEVQ